MDISCQLSGGWTFKNSDGFVRRIDGEEIPFIDVKFADAMTGVLVEFEGIFNDIFWKVVEEKMGREAIGL